MTEAKWLKCKLPQPMLEAVPADAVRKLRLFAIACCERIDQFITDPRSRAALNFAIQHVDTPNNRQKGRTQIEKAGRDAWSDAYSQLSQVPRLEGPACLVYSCAADAAVGTMKANAKEAADCASAFACFAVAWKAVHEAKAATEPLDLPTKFKAPEFAQQARLLREVFGNPFRKVKLDHAWLTSDVLALARGIYDEKAFDRMPILADALQDAGCDNDDILDHCRGDGPHVRGCWVVDLVLGKE